MMPMQPSHFSPLSTDRRTRTARVTPEVALAETDAAVRAADDAKIRALSRRLADLGLFDRTWPFTDG